LEYETSRIILLHSTSKDILQIDSVFKHAEQVGKCEQARCSRRVKWKRTERLSLWILIVGN